MFPRCSGDHAEVRRGSQSDRLGAQISAISRNGTTAQQFSRSTRRTMRTTPCCASGWNAAELGGSVPTRPVRRSPSTPVCGPRLNVGTVEHDRIRVIEVRRQGLFQIGQLRPGGQVQRKNPLPEVVHEIDQKGTAGITRRRDMHDRVDPYIRQPGLSKQSRQPAADVAVTAVLLGYGHDELDDRAPGVRRWITHRRRPVNLVKSNGAARSSR